MKKSVVSVMLSVMVLLSSTCFATIPDSEMSLGGIRLGSSMSYLLNVYPNPDRKELVEEGKFYFIEYGKTKNSVSPSVFISARNINGEGIVCNAHVSKNNGWTTPAGVHVGMDINEVYKIYGTNDAIDRDGIKPQPYAKIFYSHDYTKYLVIRVDKNGKVYNIELMEHK